MKIDIIKVKDLSPILNDIDDNAPVHLRTTKKSITIQIELEQSSYSPIAKCGKYSRYHCLHKYKDCEECLSCQLVNRHAQMLYKIIDGQKYKRCPHCGEYLPIENFRYNQKLKNYSSWCKKCHHEYRKSKKYKYDK